MQPLNVVLVWHMHQPDYRDPLSGRSLMPWTYLHALKDYGEMLQTAREVPGTRLTFNLTPTLIERLEDFSAGRFEDDWLDLARRDPLHLSREERKSLLSLFFSVYPERHIRPYPRFHQLSMMRNEQNGPPDPDRFSIQELRDLQVWFLLAWSGHCLRRDSAEIDGLLTKGGLFSESDRERLLAIYDRTVAGILERYREAERDGATEISLTPYAHPILPLLCDSSIARQARSVVVLPQVAFRNPEDARLQVRFGQKVAWRSLGERPRGMWPAEGAVSEEALGIFNREGVSWVASDEEILARSLSGGLADRRHLYRLYSFSGLPILFRDRDLSDRIGFLYADWEPRAAAADLLQRLRQIAQACPGGVVALILDGENCWERYADNGYPFLAALYRGLVEEPFLCTATVGDVVAKLSPVALPRLAPGSWINGDFDVWIGNREENTAWERLARTRRDIGPPPSAAEEPSAAWISLLKAQGSDWFWWFGDHHRTEQGEIFDRLFRHHLQAVYRHSNSPVPEDLFQTIKQTRPHNLVLEPGALFTPQIDGRVTDYFEWLAAGSIELSAGGAMHHGHNQVTGFYYGYDTLWFYLRIDFDQPLIELTGPNGFLELRFLGSKQRQVRFDPGQGLLTMQGPEGPVVDAGRASSGRIFEAALSLQGLGLMEEGCFELSCHLRNGDRDIVRWPVDGVLQLCYRGQALEASQWPIP
ncbi:MAG: glycoside hydrolase family 57 protein [Syntrophotaleaceae bacterium]